MIETTGMKIVRGTYLRASSPILSNRPKFRQKQFLAVVSNPKIAGMSFPLSYIPAFSKTLKESSSFGLGSIHVTQGFWKRIATQPKVNIEIPEDPSSFKHPALPVETIEPVWAVEFCDRLTELSSTKFRLPTPTEWAYAATGGLETGEASKSIPLNFCFGPQLPKEVANYSGSKTSRSDKYGPCNQFALFDVHGNVGDLCLGADGFVVKGGGWANSPAECQIKSSLPALKSSCVGLRVLKEIYRF